ncbi:unnamed protein product [Miscanthus lutarioriparius]|uniref:Uncharacterized protein n=1 Tax=Miscanthus lutarioriparius TaxID=422564 RepID=A0A811P962_9POAL|nr:unnamed protein product [Miscanthus lutarioriparius]
MAPGSWAPAAARGLAGRRVGPVLASGEVNAGTGSGGAEEERRGRAGVHGRGCSHGAAAARQTWLLPFLGHHEMCELRVCREAIRAGGGICNRGGERVREQRQRRSREGTFGGRRGLMWDLPP